MKALFLSADGFEDSELLVPKYRLEEAGYEVEVASSKIGVIRGIHGYEVQAGKSFADVVPEEYALLVLPGGKAPAAIRKVPAVISIVHHFFSAKKPVGAICHGPQTLITAGLMRNRRATCYHTVAKEMWDAGALYEDSEVVVDGNLVTSRKPADLPAFLRELMNVIARRESAAADDYWGDTSPIPYDPRVKTHA